MLLPADLTKVGIVCVELQNGVLGPGSVLPALAADSAEMLGNVRRLLDAARIAGARIVHATYEGPLGGHNTGTAKIWRRLDPATSSWTPGSPDTQVIAELLGENDIVLPRHHGLFPTSGTELLPVLRNLGVETVILAGVSLNLALPHTAGDIAQEGFELVIPRDAVGGTPAEYGDAVLTYTMAFLGQVTTVDEVVAELLSRSS